MPSTSIRKKLFNSTTLKSRSDCVDSRFDFEHGNLYSAYARTTTGRAIQNVLLTSGVVFILVGAVLAAPSRPPIAVLTPFIAKYVGNEAFEDQYKRFTGQCVRQLMEHLGATTGPNRPIIAKGSRYSTGATFTFGSVAP